MSSPNEGILLEGLDGSNALAFLASLGTLRTLTLALQSEKVTMGWELTGGAWRPRLWCSASSDRHTLLGLLDEHLGRDRSNHATHFVGDDKRIASFFAGVRRGTPPPNKVDQWFAALVSDVHPNATSQLQLTRRDYFAGNLDQVMANTTRLHLQRTLFEPWRFGDRLSGQSLHLEPGEDRRHAYQWNRPNGDPNRNKSGNMLGANRLAVEAIPLFLGLPSDNPDRLRVTGWTGVRSDDSRWTWPIWTSRCTLDVARSVIALPALQEDEPDSRWLKAVGVAAAYRCRRILVEQTPNLTPSVAVV